MIRKIKTSFTYILNNIDNFMGLLVSSVVIIIGLFVGVIAPLAIVAWLLWEFWPFQNELSQKLSYSEVVLTKSAVMKKIVILEFELDIDRQRVIQKIAAPTLDDRGQPTFCQNLHGFCDKKFDSSTAKKKGFQEIWDQLPSENQLLTELKNCTLKSADDWICKSKWFRSPKDGYDGYIGKSDGNWIFQPVVSDPKKWKLGLALEQWQCGGNLCFIMSIKQHEEEIQRIREHLKSIGKKILNF